MQHDHFLKENCFDLLTLLRCQGACEGKIYSRNEVRGKGHSDPKMVLDTDIPIYIRTSTLGFLPQICRRYAQDTIILKMK